MKNKAIRISIGNIILAGLLISISLPAQGPRQLLEQPRLSKPSPQAVDEEIARIQGAVSNLRRLKIIIPIVIAGVGVIAMVTALGIAAGSVLLLAFRKTMIKKFNDAMSKITIKVRPFLRKRGLMKSFEAATLAKEIYKKGELPKGLNEAIDAIFSYEQRLENLDVRRLSSEDIKGWEFLIRQAKQRVLNTMGKKLRKFRVSEEAKKLKSYYPKTFLALGVGGLVGGLGVALATAFGTVAGVIATAVGIKRGQISRALDGAYALERIERENPGTMTAKQKGAIADLEKLAKDKMIRSYMRGLRMKEVMTSVIDAAMKQNTKIIATLGTEKKARKTLAKYIRWRWEAGNLQELTGQEREHRKLMNGLTPEWEKSYKKAKIELKKIKKKITKLEGKHSRLKDLPQEIIRDYKTRIEPILKEFEVAVKPKKELGLPVIPL